MGKYKVWVSVEYADDERGIYKNVSSFAVCAGECSTAEEADDLVEKLTGKRTDAFNYQEPSND